MNRENYSEKYFKKISLYNSVRKFLKNKQYSRSDLKEVFFPEVNKIST